MLSNEEAKQEAIRKIVSDYYEKYPLVKPFVQDNGWFPISNGYTSNLHKDVKDFYNSVNKVFISAEDHEEYFSHFMPKELNELIEAVEYNQGWIRIEPDGSNLPTSGIFRVFNNNPEMIFASSNDRFDSDDVGELFEDGDITHYKPITPELPPVY